VSTHPVKKISVYVCPSEDCTNYFGASGMPDLSQQWTGPKIEDRAALEASSGSGVRHTRAACPDCRARGHEVERRLMVVNIAIPTKGPETPPLPALNGQLHPVSPRKTV
jgi:hypothetical protein